MATLPPVTLGVIILVAFLATCALRKPLERAVVLRAAATAQPQRQFYLDLLLCLLAAGMAIGYNSYILHFPAPSGIALAMGGLVAGFFVSLDMALARERTVIQNALAQHHVRPPPRRLYSITKRFALVAVTTALFVVIIIVMVISRDLVWLSGIGPNAAALAQAQKSVTYEIFFIMAVLLTLVVNLIISYSRNLKLLFENETGVLERVSRGDLSRMVPVATKDEFGVIAGHTNDMIRGLQHRIELLTALKLAEEVQQNLLPLSAPHHPRVDIAGTSIYCDETGGDYYDYFNLPEGRLGVVVADASGHGVGAALQMTTARAFLQFGARDYRGPAQLLAEVNRFLTRDSSHTSRFMSMFFLEIDPADQCLCWVRAGHDPALFYEPSRNSFRELSGAGMAMGVVADYDYHAYTHRGWSSSSLIVIGTDGIPETRNKDGRMFGLERLREVIRAHAAEPSDVIQTAVIDALRCFRNDAPQEDDITLVVVKLL
ncbi:MAG: SpoIIE family protein phosphatase [Desulfobacterales bacterium]|nr:MAG: SpoIIE family protein phosphatase [Desulfobacterales bacterium]